MIQTYKFRLIDGIFTAADANRMLDELVGSKIHYHEMEDFSNEERFGKKVLHSEERLKALKKLREEIKSVLHSQMNSQTMLSIQSDIEIKVCTD